MAVRQLLGVSSGALREALRIGWRSLLSHKLRTFLTMLGMIFGVGAVIAMLSIGEGARREAMANIQTLGSGNILLNARENEPTEDSDANAASALCLRDGYAIKGLLPDCRVTHQLRETMEATSRRDRQDVPVLGVTAEYLEQFPGMGIKGRWLTDSDGLGKVRVCVLGAEAAHVFFGQVNPVGQLLKLRFNRFPDWYTVVGVIQSRTLNDKAQDLGLRDTNLDVYIPYHTFLNRIPHYADHDLVDQIVVSVPEGGDILHAADVVRAVIQRRHNEPEDTEILVPWELIRQQQATQRMFNLIMGAIASISLLVGGIGIMNIMLSSVLERTREIGIRRAVGATATEVLLQFVLEAVILSLGGGLLGVILGIVMSAVISQIAGWQTAVSLWAVGLSFLVSVGTGIVFGVYPARRAAALDPIDALRYE